VEEKRITKIITKFSFLEIKEVINKLNNTSILIIGDIIIDHYVFVTPKGRAVKDPILSVEYKNREVYAGGIVATANHMSDFVKKIKLISLIGDQNNQVDVITNSLNKNIELKTFVKPNSPTTIKKRIVDAYRNNKLFKIEYINDKPISNHLTNEILEYLEEELPKYDFVVVGDFGHGFINEEIRRKVESKSKFIAVNVQSNSANMGYNYFDLYKRFDFLCLNEDELRLPLYRRFEEIDQVIKEAYYKFGFSKFLVTQGRSGCTFINNGELFKAPIITQSVKDTVGAGDALFAIASLLTYMKIDNELIPFLANCAGGIAANIMGNKEPVTKEKLLYFIKEVYENELGQL